MPSVFFRFIACVLVVGLLPGCALWPGWSKRKRQAALEKSMRAARDRPEFIGKITLVNSDAGFVLIDTVSVQQPPKGTTLQAYADRSSTAELRTSGVARRSFLIADLVSGTPSRGDGVWRGPLSSPAAIPRAGALIDPSATPTPAPKPRAWWKRILPRFGRRK